MTTDTDSALAFDFGERRIGVAFANRTTGTAAALRTLPANDTAAVDRDIAALIEEWKPATIVIGVPYNVDGTHSRMTAPARAFGAGIGKRYGLPVDEIDERLTSAEARMMLEEQRRSGRRRRKIRREDVDSLAARLIAETWLRDD